MPAVRHLHREGNQHQRGDRPPAPARDQGAVRAPRRADRGLGLLHLRPGFAGGVLRHAAVLRARRVRRHGPRAGAARRDAVPAHAARSVPRQLPGSRRRPRDPAGLRGAWHSDRVLRRRDRAHRPLRPAARRRARGARKRRRLSQDPLRDADAIGSQRAIVTIEQELRERLGRARGRGQAARAPAPRAAHPVRPRDAQGARLLPRHRELLAAPLGTRAGSTAADPARLPPGGLPADRRREPSDHAAGARHVPRRSLAQADAGRLRFPPAVGARQPPADFRGVRRQGRSSASTFRRRRRLGARARRWRRRRAADPADRPARPGDRDPAGARPGRRPAGAGSRRGGAAASACWSPR